MYVVGYDCYVFKGLVYVVFFSFLSLLMFVTVFIDLLLSPLSLYLEIMCSCQEPLFSCYPFLTVCLSAANVANEEVIGSAYNQCLVHIQRLFLSVFTYIRIHIIATYFKL